MLYMEGWWWKEEVISDMEDACLTQHHPKFLLSSNLSSRHFAF